MALMVCYTLVLKTLGFLISISAFMVVAIRIFGTAGGFPPWRWRSLRGISYVSFVLWLKVPLPLGILKTSWDRRKRHGPL